MPERHRYFRPKNSTVAAWTARYNHLKLSLGLGYLVGFVGARGAGKTQLGVCLIGHALKYKHTALYKKAVDIFIELRSTYNSKDYTESEVIANYAKPKLLVIDAMENRGATQFENTLINHIVDIRYDALKDTILISNQSASEFMTIIGASIVSRMNETGGIVDFTWESFRK